MAVKTETDQKIKHLGAYCNITFPDSVESIEMSLTLLAEDVNGIVVRQSEFQHGFNVSDSGRGYNSFLTPQQLQDLDSKGGFTLRVTGVVLAITMKADASEGNSEMLCATLKRHDDKVSKELDSVCSHRFLLSSAFRKSLNERVAARQGCAGLPGTVSQDVPLDALKDLMAKLPAVFERHYSSVFDTVMSATESAIKYVLPNCQFPLLEEVLKRKASAILTEQKSIMEKTIKQILRWEENIHTSNHYYMSTVQSVRESLFSNPQASATNDGADEILANGARDKFVGMMDLTAEKVKLMSNFDQEVVDLQIKVFAYWKTMKKRLLDYVQMATRTELAVEPICKMFCAGFREAIEEQAQLKSMSALLLPDADVSRRRCDIYRRLQNLTAAEKLIKEQTGLSRTSAV